MCWGLQEHFNQHYKKDTLWVGHLPPTQKPTSSRLNWCSWVWLSAAAIAWPNAYETCSTHLQDHDQQLLHDSLSGTFGCSRLPQHQLAQRVIPNIVMQLTAGTVVAGHECGQAGQRPLAQTGPLICRVVAVQEVGDLSVGRQLPAECNTKLSRHMPYARTGTAEQLFRRLTTSVDRQSFAGHHMKLSRRMPYKTANQSLFKDVGSVLSGR